MRLACLVLGYVTVLAGQTSGGAPVTKAPGDKVTLEISANSQPKRAPIAVHFDVIFPVQLMEVEGEAEAGAAARNSGKSLQCTARNSYSYGCVVSGGQNPLADGTIAILHFRIRPTAQAGTTALRIEKAVATTADSKAVSLDNTEATVVIRR